MFHHLKYLSRPQNLYALQRTTSGIGPKYVNASINDTKSAAILTTILTSFGLCVIKWAHSE